MRIGGDTLADAAKAGDKSNPQFTTYTTTSSTDGKSLQVHVSTPPDVGQRKDSSQVLILQCGQDLKYKILLPRTKVAREASPNLIVVILPSRQGRAPDMTFVRDCLDQLKFLYEDQHIMPSQTVMFHMLSFGNSIGMYALTALKAAGKIFADGIIMDSPPTGLVSTLRFWIDKAKVGQKILTRLLSLLVPSKDKNLDCTTRRDCTKATALWREQETEHGTKTPVWIIKSVHDRKVRPEDADLIKDAAATDGNDLSFMTDACASHTQFGYFAPFKTQFTAFIDRVVHGTSPQAITEHQGQTVVTPRECPIHVSPGDVRDDPGRVVSVPHEF